MIWREVRKIGRGKTGERKREREREGREREGGERKRAGGERKREKKKMRAAARAGGKGHKKERRDMKKK